MQPNQNPTPTQDHSINPDPSGGDLSTPQSFPTQEVVPQVPVAPTQQTVAGPQVDITPQIDATDTTPQVGTTGFAPQVGTADFAPSATNGPVANEVSSFGGTPQPVQPVVQPAVSPTMAVDGIASMPTPGGSIPPKKRLGKGIIVAITSGVVVALIGSVSLAYVLIKNTPEAILQDAFILTSQKREGYYDVTIDTDGDGQKFQASIAGAWKEGVASGDVTVKANEILSKDLAAHVYANGEETYIKVDDVREHINSFGSEAAQMMASYSTLIDKVDSRWLVITDKDLEEYFGVKPNDDDTYTTCVEKAMKDYQASKSQQQEVVDVYNKNKFLTLKKQKDEDIEGRGAYRIAITIIKEKVQPFADAVQGTTVLKNVQKCLPGEPSDSRHSSGGDVVDRSSEQDDTNITIEVWVDKGTRTLRKMSFVADSAKNKFKLTTSVLLDYFSEVKLEKPKAEVAIKDLMAEIQKLQQQGLQQPPSAGGGLDVMQTVLGISDRR